MIKTEKYIAFLRGINVGGHHKVPMAELRKELEDLKLKNIITLLNTGNIIFEMPSQDTTKLESKIAKHLGKVFGFPIPTIIRKAEIIEKLYQSEPFKNICMSKDIRLYVSLLQDETKVDLPLPWISEDGSYQILAKCDKCIVSVLDLAISKSVKAMAIFEKTYGKNVTTRNWKTIERIIAKL